MLRTSAFSARTEFSVTTTGKTTTLQVIREGGERAGFAVEGFAPTSRAAGQLREVGIHATTLQGFLASPK